MKKILLASLSGILMLLLLTQTASAHVKLSPDQAVVGYQKYAVSVPNEKDISTIKVAVDIPSGLDVTGVRPVPGWTISTKSEKITPFKNDDGDTVSSRISEIMWTGGEIKPGEYQEFYFSTNYTGQPTTLKFKAYQTYQDGSVVPWDGSNADHPGPSVTVLASTPIDSLTEQVNSLNDTVSKQNKTVTVAIWIASASALLGLAALLLTLKRAKANK